MYVTKHLSQTIYSGLTHPQNLSRYDVQYLCTNLNSNNIFGLICLLFWRKILSSLTFNTDNKFVLFISLVTTYNFQVQDLYTDNIFWPSLSGYDTKIYVPKNLRQKLYSGSFLPHSFSRYDVQYSWRKPQYRQYIRAFTLSIWHKNICTQILKIGNRFGQM